MPSRDPQCDSVETFKSMQITSSNKPQTEVILFQYWLVLDLKRQDSY